MAPVVVLTPNPAVDVTYDVDRQVLGETLRVRHVARRAGGKGVNVVRVLAALGVPAVSVQPLGGDTGRWFRDELAAAGIDAVSVPAPGPTRTTVAVVDGHVHPTLLAEPGAPLSDDAWAQLAEAARERAVPGGFVALAGSVPPGTEDRHVAAVVAAAHAAGARAVVDTSGPALLAAVAAGADLVLPNEAEVREATGVPGLAAGMDALLSSGAGTVVVSRGADGLVARERDGRELTQAAVPGVSGNPTGAGDAATAGLLSALVAGRPLAAALRTAAVTGAAAVLAPLAGEIDTTLLGDLAARISTD